MRSPVAIHDDIEASSSGPLELLSVRCSWRISIYATPATPSADNNTSVVQVGSKSEPLVAIYPRIFGRRQRYRALSMKA